MPEIATTSNTDNRPFRQRKSLGWFLTELSEFRLYTCFSQDDYNED